MDNLITLKFLRVVPESNNTIPFEEALDTALELGSVLQRERDISPGEARPVIVRLERLEKRRDFYFGELIRKQVDNIPPEATDEGLCPIELTENGGLGLSTAFRYHIPTKCLLIQANTSAVSHSRLKSYLKLVAHRADYSFEPIPTENAWDRFNSGEPRKFIMKVASPTTLAGLDDDCRAVTRGAAAIGEALHGAYVTIEVSMGRKNGNLDKGFLRNVINTLRGVSDAAPETVQKLSVGIAEDGTGSDMINFLDEHLVVKDELDLPSDNPERNYELRRIFLESQFSAHLPYVSERYAPA